MGTPPSDKLVFLENVDKLENVENAPFLPIIQVTNRKLNRESLTDNKKPPITGG